MIASKFPKRQKTRRACVPDGVRVYAIGDIHGRADLLDKMFNQIDADLKKRPIAHGIEVFLGDYIDRGPASREVLDRLIARSHTRHRTVFLKGNHETFLTGFISNPPILDAWQDLGGLETLMSYGIIPTINADATAQARFAAAFDRALPNAHRQFIGDLKSTFTCGDFFFVHAGVRPGIPLAKQREEDLLWIRARFLMLRRRLRQNYCSWAHSSVRTGRSCESHQHRYWGICNRAI